MRNTFFILIILFYCVGLFSIASTIDYRVIPLPAKINYVNGKPFKLTENTKIIYPDANEKLKRNARFLAEYIKNNSGLKLQLKTGKTSNNAIVLQIKPISDNKEVYNIEVSEKNIIITGASEAGVFYGIQTIRKSIPVEKVTKLTLPAVNISDVPRFGYRGMMLDASRHFCTLDSVKRWIDMLALHNINTFHWHLTDDQGWRIEIKKYPRLTEIGAWRTETVIGRNTDKYDGKPHGGFYTQKEAREIVSYAAERFINVVPEIDMPGHMLGALAAYPELGCTGGPYEVWKKWGISDDVLCMGNPKTFDFITDVLNEIMDIFPSQYIHIGGDECPKSNWKKCPKCQAKINELGLIADQKHTAEERLQSYFINYSEKIVNSRGRKIIGWDEILEGGLAPNATVMSWRGMGGGIEAAKLGNNVIMTPNTHLYFDYYQTIDTKDEPLAIGGFSSVENVYNLEPQPASLTEEQKKHIIGVQANLWREYIPTYHHVEYMVLPRMAALSEVQWTLVSNKNYDDFLKRLLQFIDVYKLNQYNYAKHIYEISANYEQKDNAIYVKLKTIDNAPVYFTTNGTVPDNNSNVFTSPLRIENNTILKAVAFRGNERSKELTEQINFSKSTTKPIFELQPINEQYKYNGVTTLVDGLKGNENFRSGRWIAWKDNDFEVLIDLKNSTTINEIAVNANVLQRSWLFGARSMQIFTSNDGTYFQLLAEDFYKPMLETDRDGIYEYKLNFPETKARFVKLKVSTEKMLPSWHTGAGSSAFLFVDEITLK